MRLKTVRLLRDPRPFAGRSKDRPLHHSDVGHALQGVPRVSGSMGRDTAGAPLKADTTYGFRDAPGVPCPGANVVLPD